MSLLNVNEWTVQQVVEWFEGLDPTICHYGPDFIRKQINGARLLNLMAGDLIQIGVHKVGDQLLMHEAIQSLRDEMETDRITLQTLASNLSVRCKTYRSELSDLPRKSKIPTRSLSTAAYLLDASKPLIRWLTRYPFLGVIEYDEITKKLTRHCFELAMLCQRDTFADNASEEVQYLCTKVIELCDSMIYTKDSLAYQPAAIDILNIRKRHEQELGLQFETSYFGLHIVSGVDINSPAQQSGGTQHLERGDEILQVNYQTVVGWVQPSVISLLHENPCEVILTIKRRPRHASNLLGHMYLKPNRVPVRKIVSPVAEEAAEKEFGEKDMKKFPLSGTGKNEESEEPCSSASSNAEARFWKLYPTRPRGVLRRRATVSGTSPISTRPPVTFTQDDSYGHKTRPPLDKSKSESNKLDVDDHILKLFVGDSNVKGSRVTLPFMENLSATEPLPTAPKTIPQAKSNVKVNKADAIASSSGSSKLGNGNTGVKKVNSASSVPMGAPMYSGFLHERAHWKFGPRWNRHKAGLYRNLLVIGSHSFEISEQEYRVAPAIEVHSRPFAFKLEKAKENQEKSVVYIAAESEAEMEIWLKLLSKECGQIYPFESYSHSESGSGGKLYRRSFSLQSTAVPEKPPRRSSLPPKHEFKVSSRYRVPRTEIAKLKSQSTSGLDEPRRLIVNLNNLEQCGEIGSLRSNISSITITSVRREALIGGKGSGESKIDPNPDLYSATALYMRSESSRSVQEDFQKSSTLPMINHIHHHQSPSPQKSKRNCSNSSTLSLPLRTNNKKAEILDDGLSTSTPKLTNKNDLNRNIQQVDDNQITCCLTCGRFKAPLADASVQTDDNLFLLITSNHQSIV